MNGQASAAEGRHLQETPATLPRDISERARTLSDDLRECESLARVVIHSVLRLPSEQLQDLVTEPASIGTDRWDALLQALVA